MSQTQKTKTKKTSNKKANKEVVQFEHPLLASTTIVCCYDDTEDGLSEIDHVHCLLVKRKNDPYKDYWSLPGGMLNIGETILDCAVRELKEETGLDLIESQNGIRYICYMDNPNRDSRGRIIDNIFYTIYHKDEIEGMNLNAASDAKELKLFKMTEIFNPNFKLAFDHKEALSKFMYVLGVAIVNSLNKMTQVDFNDEELLASQADNPN